MEHQLAAKSGEVQVLWDRVREKDGKPASASSHNSL